MFAYPSTESIPVGGPRAIHSDLTYAANKYWVLSAFTGTSGSSLSYGTNAITFAAIPTVTVTGVSPDGATGTHASIENIATHEIKVLTFTGAGVASSNDTVHIMAMGLADFSEGPS